MPSLAKAGRGLALGAIAGLGIYRPPADAPLGTLIDTALNMQANTCSFDVSGHPAFTLPCGRKSGLPIGLMLVGRHFDETTLIKLASAIEASSDWKQ